MIFPGRIVAVLTLLIAASVPAGAQSGLDGRYRTSDGFAWEVGFQTDRTLRGSVTSCSSVLGTFPVSDAKLDGNKLTFTCTSGDQRRQLAFDGVVGSDEITLTWQLTFLRGDPNYGRADDSLFGPTAPKTFTVRRIPETPIGNWRALDATDNITWELELRGDPASPSARVSSCSSNRGTFAVTDAKFASGTLTFTCKATNSQRTLSVTGKLNGNEFTFSWRKQAPADDTRRVADDVLFGPAAPPQFVARRVPETILLPERTPTLGVELAAAVNLPADDVKAEGKVFLPRGVTRARVVLVAIAWGIGFEVFSKPRWTELAKSVNGALVLVKLTNIDGSAMDTTGARTVTDDARDHALTAVLRRLSDESGHPELADAPLIFWGHSYAAGVVATYAERFAERTLGFVRYQGGGQLSGDLRIVTKMPVLYFDTAPLVGPEFENARRDGAPWTTVKENVDHQVLSDDGAEFTISWIKGVIDQRLTPNGSIRPIGEDAGWVGNIETMEYGPATAYSGVKSITCWLPDQATAQAWKALVATFK